jgi:SpoIID/LytB domain protein
MPAALVLSLVLVSLLFLFPIERSPALQEVYVFEGSGWGHGVGMCQYGARGMAEHGFDYRQILTYYYQGTRVADWSCPAAIRVGLLEGVSSLQLTADSGSFILYIGAAGEGDIPGGVIAPGETWTVVADPTGRFSIHRPDGSRLNNALYGGTGSPLSIRGAQEGNVLRLPQNGQRRVSHLTNYVPLQVQIYGRGNYALRAVLLTWFETYLKGVAEVPGSWPAEAVKAQAVAARSYAVRAMGKHASSGYDVCDEVHCQYYQGYDKELDAGWVQAVEATAGEVLAYGDEVAQCFYSSSCGGHTDNNEDVWAGSPVPYLRGVPDPYCMDDVNPYAHWTVTYTREQMEQMLNSRPGTYVGTLYSMDLSDRTPSGRVRHATFTGSAGTVTITGEQLRSYLNLRSAMVNVTPDNFDEYLLLANPGEEAASATVEMATTSGKKETVEVEVPPFSRRTVHVDEYFYREEVAARVTSDREITAERAEYFRYGGERDGGSCGPGVPAASREWFLAEGYTAQAFDTWILVYNPGDKEAQVQLDLMREDGHLGNFPFTVPAESRVTVGVDSLEGFSSCAFSARLVSDRGVITERAVYFESEGRKGGHVSPGAASPSTTWCFAEGYTAGSFDTWILVGNPSEETAAVTFHLYRPGGGEGVTVDRQVAPHSRYTLHVDEYLDDSEVAVFLESDRPVVAERAMYFDYYGKEGGSCSLGTPSPEARWYLAEGYTGGDFDEYILVANPGPEEAEVRFTFYGGEGLAGEYSSRLAPRSRYTLHVDQLFPGEEISVCVEETAGRGIVVERAMYFDYYGRRGGHASPGLAGTSTTWYFAEGYTGS